MNRTRQFHFLFGSHDTQVFGSQKNSLMHRYLLLSSEDFNNINKSNKTKFKKYLIQIIVSRKARVSLLVNSVKLLL